MRIPGNTSRRDAALEVAVQQMTEALASDRAPGFLAEAEVVTEAPNVPVIHLTEAMPEGFTEAPRAERCLAALCLHEEHVTRWRDPSGQPSCPFSARSHNWWVTSGQPWLGEKAKPPKDKRNGTRALVGGPWNGMAITGDEDLVFVVGSPSHNWLVYEPSDENRRHPLLGYYWRNPKSGVLEWGTGVPGRQP